MQTWSYLTEYESEKHEILAAVEEVLASGQLILGEKVMAFEKAFAQYCGVEHGVGVDNGTNAIFLALKALDIGPGDEVITVSLTAVPTVSAIVSCGATPVFVDVDERTFLMDVAKIEGAITSKTKCIIPVHLYGQCVDMDEVNRIAKKNGLKVVEDCAQSHGAVYKDKQAGSLANIAATSFYPTKNLGTYGDGGMVLTDDEVLAARVRRLRFYGMEGERYAVEHGYNCRLDELHAAILLTKLAHLDEYIAKRRAIAERYQSLLNGAGLILPFEETYGRHAFHMFAVRHPHRDRILQELENTGISLSVNYRWPVHLMDAYKYLGYAEGSLPVTEKLCKEVFCLPVYPSFSVEMQNKLAEELKR